MDPNYNPGVSDQACDRVHRIGQTREVSIFHLIMEGSIEEAIVEIQQKKRSLAALSLNRLGTKENQRQKLEEMRSLFNRR
jgi:SNF2 family DNA or RNA helicase